MTSTADSAPQRPPNSGLSDDIFSPPPGTVPWPLTRHFVEVPKTTQPCVAGANKLSFLADPSEAIIADPLRSSSANALKELSVISECPMEFLTNEWEFLMYAAGVNGICAVFAGLHRFGRFVAVGSRVSWKKSFEDVAMVTGIISGGQQYLVVKVRWNKRGSLFGRGHNKRWNHVIYWSIVSGEDRKKYFHSWWRGWCVNHWPRGVLSFVEPCFCLQNSLRRCRFHNDQAFGEGNAWLAHSYLDLRSVCFWPRRELTQIEVPEPSQMSANVNTWRKRRQEFSRFRVFGGNPSLGFARASIKNISPSLWGKIIHSSSKWITAPMELTNSQRLVNHVLSQNFDTRMKG